MSAPRIAALPMYDADRGAVEAWWQAIAAACRAEGLSDVPSTLEWPTHLDSHWRDPRLLLGQTCGRPLVTGLGDVTQVVGAFAYAVPGCDGIDYRSQLTTRADDSRLTLAEFRGAVAVVNDRGSQSGCVALGEAVSDEVGAADAAGFFAEIVTSGSHRASLDRLHAGVADIAAIDAVTLAGIARATPEALDGLHGIGWTPAAPGLPLITSATTSPQALAALRRALSSAAADARWTSVRQALFIDGYRDVPAAVWTSRSGSGRPVAILGDVVATDA